MKRIPAHLAEGLDEGCTRAKPAPTDDVGDYRAELTAFTFEEPARNKRRKARERTSHMDVWTDEPPPPDHDVDPAGKLNLYLNDRNRR